MNARAGLERTLIHRCRGRDVLKGGTGGIEDDDLIVRGSSGYFAYDNLAEFGMHVLGQHESSRDGMVRLADVAAVHSGQRDGEHVRDLVLDAPSAEPWMTLLHVVTEMDTYEVDALPVIDGDAHVERAVVWPRARVTGALRDAIATWDGVVPIDAS